MLTISPVYQDFLKRRSREWLIKVDINNVEYDHHQIIDIQIENDIVPENEFEIGTAIISRCVLRLRTTDEIPPNAKVIPYVALSLSGMTWDTADYLWNEADFAWDGSIGTEWKWIPLGTFFIDNRKQQQLIWTFECFDVLTFADVAYVSELSYPASMQDVWDEICTQCDLEYDSSVQIDPSYTIPAGPAGYTCRQVLGYIAGAHGASVYANREGKLRWRKYTASESPVYDMTEADYMRIRQTNPIKTYKKVVVVYDPDDQLAYEAGSGTENETLYLENPFMTQTMTNNLLGQINGFSYMPIEMDARGYPHLEHGDRIHFKRTESLSWLEADSTWDGADVPWDGLQTYQTLILRQSFSIMGGLGMTIDAPSISEQESEFGIEGSLTAAVNRLNKNAVRYGKPYHGVTHSREDGIVTQRIDGSKKLTINSDVFLEWIINNEKKFWYDETDDAIKFSGIIEASDFVGGTIAIGSGNNIFKAGPQGIWAGHSNFNDAPFSVNMQGKMKTVDGEFQGAITSSTITGGTITIGSGNNVFKVASNGIWAGHSNFNNAPFRVSMQGHMKSVGGEFEGTITASQFVGGNIVGTTITGGLIQTAASGYPRIELNSDDNLLRAWSDPFSSLMIYALYASNFSPAIVLNNLANTSLIWQFNDELHLNSNTNLYLAPNNFVKIDSWSALLNTFTGRTLQQELNWLDARITALGG